MFQDRPLQTAGEMGATVTGIWFTIQPRAGAQQKHVDALSRAPIPGKSEQQPIVLDEFPERVVPLVQSWDERVVALPTRVAQTSPNDAVSGLHRA